MSSSWLDRFPGLRALEPETAASLEKGAQLVDLPAGQTVFGAGDECHNYLLVIDGSVRVQMTSESGREIVLYRVDSGESCVLTTSCLLAHETYAAEGITETPVHAVAIPARLFLDLLGRSAALRSFVFTTYGSRIAELMMLVEEVAFGRLDIRLARFLLKHGAGDEVGATHQTLAVELGTAREVVSRQLKDFERHGWVKLSRGRIRVLNPEALHRLADQD
jgi:CRP/FNR family transcriptional regulator